jgi:hypothetical protein
MHFRAPLWGIHQEPRRFFAPGLTENPAHDGAHNHFMGILFAKQCQSPIVSTHNFRAQELS